MPIVFQQAGLRDTRLRLTVALLIVYIVWGTTYHALNLAMRDMPPLLMNGTRFLVAGAVMLAIARWQRLPWPTAAQWRHAALIGALMVFGAMGMVVMAQKMGIGSGLMATVVTTMPMWLALWTRWGGEAVAATSWIGLVQVLRKHHVVYIFDVRVPEFNTNTRELIVLAWMAGRLENSCQ